jgi:hypothetical protein
MDNIFKARGSTFIKRPINETFEFLCNPAVKSTELSPFEEEMVEREPMQGVGSTYRSIIELAARKLNCTTRCVEYEPHRRLVTQVEGDLEGIQNWVLAAEKDGTRVQLSIEFAAPEWLPAYLHDEDNAARWSKTLVEQTLTRVRIALEPSS